MKNPIRQYLPDNRPHCHTLPFRTGNNVTRKYCEGRYTNRINSRGTVWLYSFYSSLLLLHFSSLVLSCFLVLNTFPNSLIPSCLSVVIRSFFLSNSRSSYPCSLFLPHLRRLRLLSLLPSLKINLVHRIVLPKYQPRLHVGGPFFENNGGITTSEIEEMPSQQG